MRVRISERVMGTPSALVYDTLTGSFHEPNDDRDDMAFMGETSGVGERDRLDDLFALEGIAIDPLPQKRFVNAMSLVDRNAISSNPMWSSSMPHEAYRNFIKRLVGEISAGIQRSDAGYFDETFARSSSVLHSLQRAKIDRSAWDSFWHSTGGNSSVGSFEPDSRGYASAVTYDRFGTRTGRLRITNGPQVLNLPKEARSMIVPQSEDGAIVMFDYVSFEAQIVLAVTGRSTHADVYEAIMWDVFGGEIARDRVKAASLSLLFGAGNDVLSMALGLRGQELGAAIEDLMRFFGVRELQQRLMDELVDDKIRNHYGRLIHIPEASRHLIVNSYVQSTAVDAALLGFAQLLDCVREQNLSVRPLFVIHDALMIDCTHDDLKCLDVLKRAARSISGFGDVTFPCRIETLACNS